MIEYKYRREKELLLEYAAELADTQTTELLTRGIIKCATEARILAKFYWRMVDASTGDDIEPWLERIHTTLSIACGNAGYGDIWTKEIPDDRRAVYTHPTMLSCQNDYGA